PSITRRPPRSTIRSSATSCTGMSFREWVLEQRRRHLRAMPPLQRGGFHFCRRLYKRQAVSFASAKARVRRRSPSSTFFGGLTLSAQKPISNDSFNCRKTLNVDGKSYVYYSLPDAEA